MAPPVVTTGLRTRESDRIARTPAEAKSWAPSEPTRTIYTHNASHFARNDAVEPRQHEEEAEPALRPPPSWMLMLAGAAVASLMGVLLGGFLNI